MAPDESEPGVLLADRMGSLVTDGMNLYYSECSCSAARIWRVPIDGGTLTEIVSPAHPFGLYADFVCVFLTDPNTGSAGDPNVSYPNTRSGALATRQASA
jgi:hypothetical protein